MMPLTRHLPLLLFLAGLTYLVYQIVGSLLEPLLWAIILAYASWPAFCRLRDGLRGRKTLAATCMVALLGIAVIAPVIGMTVVIQREVTDFVRHLPEWLEQRSWLEARVARLPLIGDELARRVAEWSDLGDLIRQQALPRLRGFSSRALNLLGNAGVLAGQWILSLFLTFFLYRDGEELIAEVRHGLRLGIGERADNYLDIAQRTSRAVLYGIVLTAIVQGSVAGLGYWGVSLPNPALLTILTIALALLPFGALVVWVGCCVWLFAQGEVWRATGLLVWGSLVVSWVDNLVRPLVISQATRIPFALVVLGILGGLLKFGLLGLFVGPVALAIAHAAWEEWLRNRITPAA